MKIVGTLRDFLKTKNGGVVTFDIPNFRHVEEVSNLQTDKLYSIEIKEAKSKRSLQQNSYLWALLSEIDKTVNGDRSNDEWSIYIEALERAGAKCEYIGALPETETLLKENFRAIKFIKKIDLNGKDGNMYKVFLGSSKMDKSEMAALIDTVLDMAEEVGIDTDYYSNLLRG